MRLLESETSLQNCDVRPAEIAWAKVKRPVESNNVGAETF